MHQMCRTGPVITTCAAIDREIIKCWVYFLGIA